MTTLMKAAALTAAVLAMAGCAVNSSVPIASRDAPLEAARSGDGVQQQSPAYRVESVTVLVPETLRVSEANTYYPNADIVWRGDAPGNRWAQVQAIFEEAIGRSRSQLTEGRPADLEVEVMRFHSLTDKTRYTLGGVHSIKFKLTLRDPQSGEILEQRIEKADLKAYGGSKAVAMEVQGMGQKVRITQHLADTFVKELSGHPA